MKTIYLIKAGKSADGNTVWKELTGKGFFQLIHSDDAGKRRFIEIQRASGRCAMIGFWSERRIHFFLKPNPESGKANAANEDRNPVAMTCSNDPSVWLTSCQGTARHQNGGR